MAETEKQAREELEKFLAHTNDDNRSGAPPSSDPDEAKIDKLIAQNVPNQSDVHDGPVAIRPMVTAPKLIGKAPPATAPKPVSAMSSVAPSGMPQTAIAGAQRRNIGCGFWPIGSDADRDCQMHRYGN